MDVSVVVLAAGQGSRMKSSQPKVLHCLAGQPLAAHVVKVARQFTSDISLVIGHGADQVRQFFAEQPLKFCVHSIAYYGTKFSKLFRFGVYLQHRMATGKVLVGTIEY